MLLLDESHLVLLLLLGLARSRMSLVRDDADVFLLLLYKEHLLVLLIKLSGLVLGDDVKDEANVGVEMKEELAPPLPGHILGVGDGGMNSSCAPPSR